MGDQRQPVYDNAGFRKLAFEGEQIKDNRKWPSELFCSLRPITIFHYHILFRKFMNIIPFGLLSLTRL